MAMFIRNCRKLTLSSAQLFRSSSVASQIVARHTSSYESQKFPGYSVIYCLESIRAVSIVNRLKRNASIVAVITAPAAYGLEMIDILPYPIANPAIYAAMWIALTFHAIGIYCNNVVGFVYVKKGTTDLMVSYVNYWGKRIDIKTTIDDINCSESSPNYYMPFFNAMKINEPKVTLKILSKGKIIDDEEFYKLFGF